MRIKLLLLLVAVFAVPSMALRVELSNDTFATSGDQPTGIYLSPTTAKNDRFEVYVQSRIVDAETGMDELDDVEDLIYPNQLLLQPDEQQVVR